MRQKLRHFCGRPRVKTFFALLHSVGSARRIGNDTRNFEFYGISKQHREVLAHRIGSSRSVFSSH